MAAGRIGHPAIAEVFDVGVTVHGAPYLTMELLRGQSLHDALAAGPLAVPSAIAITRQLLSALGAAHKAGIVHRDVKPANLWLCDEGTEDTPILKVLDFGIAKNNASASVTSTGAVIGTPLYMAPEQALAVPDLDARADLWSAGAVLFEMLTGRPVHVAPSLTAQMVKTVTEPAPRVTEFRPDAATALADVVAKALLIEREQRYATAEEMDAALATLDVARALTAPPKPAPPARRVLLPLLAVAAGASVVVVLVRATSPLPTREASEISSASRVLPSASTSAAPPTALAPQASSSVRAPAQSAESASVRATAPHRSTAALGARVVDAATPIAVPSCPVGLVWQQDHCERPLATKAPF
jgi:serine/threonine-protein kinase